VKSKKLGYAEGCPSIYALRGFAGFTPVAIHCASISGISWKYMAFLSFNDPSSLCAEQSNPNCDLHEPWIASLRSQ
jgi:hypothetical protein